MAQLRVGDGPASTTPIRLPPGAVLASGFDPLGLGGGAGLAALDWGGFDGPPLRPSPCPLKLAACPGERRQGDVSLIYQDRNRRSVSHLQGTLNPLTAGVAYIRVFFLISTLLPPFKHGKDKMWHQSARFENSWHPFCQIWIIFTHLKLWITSPRHNFKWVKIQIE